jgi:hypothetical protein
VLTTQHVSVCCAAANPPDLGFDRNQLGVTLPPVVYVHQQYGDTLLVIRVTKDDMQYCPNWEDFKFKLVASHMRHHQQQQQQAAAMAAGKQQQCA